MVPRGTSPVSDGDIPAEHLMQHWEALAQLPQFVKLIRSVERCVRPPTFPGGPILGFEPTKPPTVFPRGTGQFSAARQLPEDTIEGPLPLVCPA